MEEIEIGPEGAIGPTKEEQAYLSFIQALTKQSGHTSPSKHRLVSGALATQTTLGKRRHREHIKSAAAKRARKINR